MMSMLQQPLLRWKEWIPLVTHQQRLRNLIQILGYNINSDRKDKKKDVSYYYTLHLSAMCAPFYTSEKISKENPVWSEVSFHSTYGSATGVVIRLWQHDQDEDTVVTVWCVYFSGLTNIGPQLFTSDCTAFCSNTLVFYMHGGYFTSPDFFKDDQPTIARVTAITLNQADISNSYKLDSLLRLHSVQRSIKEVSDEARELHDKILSGNYVINSNEIRENSPFLRKLLSQSKPPKGSHKEILNVKKDIEITKFRIQLIQEEKSRVLNKLQRLIEVRNRLHANNRENVCKLKDERDKLAERTKFSNEKKKCFFEIKELLTITNAQFILRQKQIIVEFAYIYPIHKLPDGKYKICDVVLPNSEDFEGYHELELSVALGFTLHLVQMISYIINVPLRYPVIHCGSRSKIVDHINEKIPDKEREFCLFARDKDRSKFNYAVYLLNKNIAQLRWYCGIGTSDLRTTLPNLESLIQSCFATNPDNVETSLYTKSLKINKLKNDDTSGSSLDKQLDKCHLIKPTDASACESASQCSSLPYEDTHSIDCSEQDSMYPQTWQTNNLVNIAIEVNSKNPEETNMNEDV